MKTIKFRGKRIDNLEWIYGVPINTHIGDYIITEENPHVCSLYGYMEVDEFGQVDPDTVGQFTELSDKNGKKIYEGDIVSFDDTPYCAIGNKYQGVVVMHNGTWCVRHYDKCFDVDFYSPLFADDFANRKTIILGNIYDNPDLLKGGEK